MIPNVTKALQSNVGGEGKRWRGSYCFRKDTEDIDVKPREREGERGRERGRERDRERERERECIGWI